MKGSDINKAYRSANVDNYMNNPLIVGKVVRSYSTTKKRDVPELEIRLGSNGMSGLTMI